MDIMSKFNLPKYVKGKTFAEASALIAKKFKDNESPESIATLNELQDRLRQAQEFVKAEQEARTKPKQAATEAQARGLNEGADASASEPASNKYNKGGGLFSKLFGGYMQAATGAMDIANNMFGKTGVDTSGATDGPDVNVGGESLGGAMKGAQAGMAFGPMGAAVGGVLGGVGGLVGGNKKKKAAAEASYQYDTGNHNRAVNRYKTGGELLANMFEDGGDTDPVITDAEKALKEMKHYLATGRKLQYAIQSPESVGVKKLETGPIINRGQMDSIMGKDPLKAIDTSGLESGLADIGISPEAQLQESATKALKGLGENTNTNDKPKFNPMELLRYAPAAMNVAQLAGLKKPDEIGLDRLGNKYNEQLVDERGLQNQVQEGTANVRNAILSSSGGSGSTARANLLASQLQGQNAMSNAYMQATEANRAEKRAGQQFDLNVDQTNLGQSNQETDLNLEQQAGYQTNKSKLLAQLGNDLGGVGKEEMLKKYPELMGLSYGWRGTHSSKKKKKKSN